MNYWLLKTEPSTFGIEDLKAMKHQTDHWDGIRNYQVRNMIRDNIKLKDQALLYHSNCKPPGIVGLVEIVREAYPDFTAFDKQSKYYDPKSREDNPRWFMMDVKYVKTFRQMITLEELKANPRLKDMLILRKGNRLSITPVTQNEWETILSMSS